MSEQTGRKEELYSRKADNDGRIYVIPVGIIYGAKPGKVATIFAGQHGTEYDGIEAAQRVFREVDPADVSGTIKIGMVINVESFENWVQFAPTPVPVIAMMKELAVGSDFLINCHGGEFTEGMHPYTICRLVGRPDLDETAMRMAEAFGLPYISISKYRGEAPKDQSGVRAAWWLWPKRSMADELQIPEITPEVGERGSRDDLGLMFNGIVNVLRDAGVLAGKAVMPIEKPRVIGERYWLTAAHTGIFFPEVVIGEDVTAGQCVGVVRDYFGNILQNVIAPAPAKVMNMNWGMPVKENAFLLWLGDVSGDAHHED